MRNLPVHWFEGMFLRPQHFQASDRYWHELVAGNLRCHNAYNYGLRSCDVSTEAVENQQFELRSCEAILRDGSLVAVSDQQGLERVDLKDAFSGTAKVRLHLAVPMARSGSKNVGNNPSGSVVPRWHDVPLPVADESRGSNEQEIQFKSLAVRILATDDLSGWESIPLGQVQRSSTAGNPQLDPDYYPPVLALEAWKPLSELVRSIYDLIGKKIEVLSGQVRARSINLRSHEPGDLERYFMLSDLNEALAQLSIVAFAQGVHPFDGYQLLCGIIGRLSIYGPQRRVPEIPKYDHDDLARIYKWAYQQIVILLDIIRDYEYRQRFFESFGSGLRVSIDAEWLHAQWKWFVGVEHEGINDAECREMLAPNALNWKLGSEQNVDTIFRTGLPGLHLVPAERPPSALPAHTKWQYYEVTRDGTAWNDVFGTQTLAMRLNENLIVSRNKFEDRDRLTIRYRGKQVTLEFALFAVRTSK